MLWRIDIVNYIYMDKNHDIAEYSCMAATIHYVKVKVKLTIRMYSCITISIYTHGLLYRSDEHNQ